MKEKIICSICGRDITEEPQHNFNGKCLCEDCLEVNTNLCACCGERIWTEEIHGDDYIVLCRHCYDSYYTTCEECGSVIHTESACYDDDEDRPYCLDCYNKLFRSAIRSYNYKPEPIFYGSGNLYLGVEIELDKGGEDNDNARRILDIPNEDGEKLYAKHDGSIYDGFEIVSHPMTAEEDERKVYLPHGNFVDYWTKEPVNNGWFAVKTDNIPVS